MTKRTILSQEDENWVNEWLLVELDKFLGL